MNPTAIPLVKQWQALWRITSKSPIHEVAPKANIMNVAAIYSGTTPYTNGIVGDNWMDRSTLRVLNCVDDALNFPLPESNPPVAFGWRPARQVLYSDFVGTRAKQKRGLNQKNIQKTA